MQKQQENEKIIFFFFQIRKKKKLKVKLMSFCYINAETKLKKRTLSFFLSNRNKFTSPANEFLPHECRNNSKMKKINSLLFNQNKFTSPANEFPLHKCRNKKKRIYSFSNPKTFKSQPMSFCYKGIAKKTGEPIVRCNQLIFFKSVKSILTKKKFASF